VHLDGSLSVWSETDAQLNTSLHKVEHLNCPVVAVGI